MAKTNLQLVAECDNLPYPNDPTYSALISSYYTFSLLTDWTPTCTTHTKVGYLLPATVSAMPWTPPFLIDHTTRDVSIPYAPGTDVESTALRELLLLARSRSTFAVLGGWRNELYPIHGLSRPVHMERAGSGLFGIHTVGVHMTGYTYASSPSPDLSPSTTTTSTSTSTHTSNPTSSSPSRELKIWVPRRAKTKQTYPGMLDNTVAGGIAAGEDQFESLVREAGEEASLPEEFVRREVRAGGAISYFYVRDGRAGGESGLLQPETQYVYDLEMPEGMVPRPADEEVEEFYLWGVEEVRGALGRGEFKPNCAVCLIDFFVRRGVITAGEEGDYLEIVQRIHRRIMF